MAYCRSRIFLLLLFSFVVLSGCIAKKTVFHKLPKSNFASYSAIEIPDFHKTDKEWVPYDSSSVIPDMVAEKLRKTNGFNEIIRSDADSRTDARVLVLDGSVTGYNRGCKLCEWYMGFNDNGKSSVTVRIRLVDKITGDLITDAEIAALAKEPGFGESRYIRIVDEIVNIVEKVNRDNS